jgi:hypothetical protein
LKRLTGASRRDAKRNTFISCLETIFGRFFRAISAYRVNPLQRWEDAFSTPPHLPKFGRRLSQTAIGIIAKWDA